MSSFEAPSRQAYAVSVTDTEQAILTASGEADFAEKIIELAREHGIPIKSEPELATLFSSVPPGEQLPEELLLAVSEIIAFFYELEGQLGGDNSVTQAPTSVDARLR